MKKITNKDFFMILGFIISFLFWQNIKGSKIIAKEITIKIFNELVKVKEIDTTDTKHKKAEIPVEKKLDLLRPKEKDQHKKKDYNPNDQHKKKYNNPNDQHKKKYNNPNDHHKKKYNNPNDQHKKKYNNPPRSVLSWLGLIIIILFQLIFYAILLFFLYLCTLDYSTSDNILYGFLTVYIFYTILLIYTSV